MPCWVAPVVAAELWGVSLNHVLVAIADGTVPARQEYGFTLVDVAPHVAAHPPTRRPGQPPPRTYVFAEELDAAEHVQPPPPPDDAPAEVPTEPAMVDDNLNSELPPLDAEEDDQPITHWREVRSRVGRSRQPPRRQPPLAA
jgi:hypothetical protein